MEPSEPVLGIDYGTSNSSMAWVDPRTGKAEILRNAEGEDKTRSMVYFGPDEILVGTPAVHMLEDDASRGFVYPPGAKRFISKKFVRRLNGRDFTPFDVAVEVIQKLRKDAERVVFSVPVNRAVIGVPATFNELERDEIRRAGLTAGFRDIELIEEPVAAALAYIQDGHKIGRCILVYDLGGGTFDLAVVNRGDDGATPELALPSAGLRRGGESFDMALYRHVTSLGEREGRSFAATGQVNLSILDQCRKRKENLSSRHQVLVSSLLADGKPFRHTIDRQVFESLISEIVDQTVVQAQRLIKDAASDGHAVDTVVLIGGSSRIPLVSSRLEASLPFPPTKWHHQDVAVALGAAYHAHTFWSHRSRLHSVLPAEGAVVAANAAPSMEVPERCRVENGKDDPDKTYLTSVAVHDGRLFGHGNGAVASGTVATQQADCSPEIYQGMQPEAEGQKDDPVDVGAGFGMLCGLILGIIVFFMAVGEGQIGAGLVGGMAVLMFAGGAGAAIGRIVKLTRTRNDPLDDSIAIGMFWGAIIGGIIGLISGACSGALVVGLTGISFGAIIGYFNSKKNS